MNRLNLKLPSFDDGNSHSTRRYFIRSGSSRKPFDPEPPAPPKWYEKMFAKAKQTLKKVGDNSKMAANRLKASVNSKAQTLTRGVGEIPLKIPAGVKIGIFFAIFAIYLVVAFLGLRQLTCRIVLNTTCALDYDVNLDVDVPNYKGAFFSLLGCEEPICIGPYGGCNCASTLCKNGGNATRSGQDWSCECLPGWAGQFCHVQTFASVASAYDNSFIVSAACGSAGGGEFYSASGESNCAKWCHPNASIYGFPDIVISAFDYTECGVSPKIQCQICSGHGSCDPYGNCICETGYQGNRGGLGSVSCHRACPRGNGEACGGEKCGTCVETACICRGGYFAANDSLPCSACPGGTYRKFSDKNTQCTTCPTGHFSVNYTAISNNANLTDTSFSDGPSQCRRCSRGTYNDEVERSQCLQCPAKFHSAIKGLGNCTACPIGFWTANLTNSHSCSVKPCILGEYRNGNTCLTCPAGTVTITISFNATMPPYACSNCTPGLYQNEAAKSICKKCGVTAILTYSNTTGTWENRSTYSTQNCQVLCKTCPTAWESVPIEGASTYCVDTSVNCTDGQGQFAIRPLKNTCKDCPKGQYSSLNGAVRTCKSCPRGTYQPYTKTTSCIQCPPGTNVSHWFEPIDLTDPLAMPSTALGQYSLVLGATKCFWCPAQYYAFPDTFNSTTWSPISGWSNYSDIYQHGAVNLTTDGTTCMPLATYATSSSPTRFPTESNHTGPIGTFAPTLFPTAFPTALPSANPTLAPTNTGYTYSPTGQPTDSPTPKPACLSKGWTVNGERIQFLSSRGVHCYPNTKTHTVPPAINGRFTWDPAFNDSQFLPLAYNSSGPLVQEVVLSDVPCTEMGCVTKDEICQDLGAGFDFDRLVKEYCWMCGECQIDVNEVTNAPTQMPSTTPTISPTTAGTTLAPTTSPTASPTWRDPQNCSEYARNTAYVIVSNGTSTPPPCPPDDVRDILPSGVSWQTPSIFLNGGWTCTAAWGAAYGNSSEPLCGEQEPYCTLLDSNVTQTPTDPSIPDLYNITKLTTVSTRQFCSPLRCEDNAYPNNTVNILLSGLTAELSESLVNINAVFNQATCYQNTTHPIVPTPLPTTVAPTSGPTEQGDTFSPTASPTAYPTRNPTPPPTPYPTKTVHLIPNTDPRYRENRNDNFSIGLAPSTLTYKNCFFDAFDGAIRTQNYPGDYGATRGRLRLDTCPTCPGAICSEKGDSSVCKENSPFFPGIGSDPKTGLPLTAGCDLPCKTDADCNPESMVENYGTCKGGDPIACEVLIHAQLNSERTINVTIGNTVLAGAGGQTGAETMERTGDGFSTPVNAAVRKNPEDPLNYGRCDGRPLLKKYHCRFAEWLDCPAVGSIDAPCDSAGFRKNDVPGSDGPPLLGWTGAERGPCVANPYYDGKSDAVTRNPKTYLLVKSDPAYWSDNSTVNSMSQDYPPADEIAVCETQGAGGPGASGDKGWRLTKPGFDPPMTPSFCPFGSCCSYQPSTRTGVYTDDRWKGRRAWLTYGPRAYCINAKKSSAPIGSTRDALMSFERPPMLTPAEIWDYRLGIGLPPSRGGCPADGSVCCAFDNQYGNGCTKNHLTGGLSIDGACITAASVPPGRGTCKGGGGIDCSRCGSRVEPHLGAGLTRDTLFARKLRSTVENHGDEVGWANGCILARGACVNPGDADCHVCATTHDLDGPVLEEGPDPIWGGGDPIVQDAGGKCTDGQTAVGFIDALGGTGVAADAAPYCNDGLEAVSQNIPWLWHWPAMTAQEKNYRPVIGLWNESQGNSKRPPDEMHWSQQHGGIPYQLSNSLVMKGASDDESWIKWVQADETGAGKCGQLIRGTGDAVNNLNAAGNSDCRVSFQVEPFLTRPTATPTHQPTSSPTTCAAVAGSSKFDANDTTIHVAKELWLVHKALSDETYEHISSWNTADVTDMESLWQEVHEFNEDIRCWNTVAVETMETMFNGAHSFNQDIGRWNTANVCTMYAMFFDATVFNQNLGNWDVTGLDGVFVSSSTSLMFTAATAFEANCDAVRALCPWNRTKAQLGIGGICLEPCVPTCAAILNGSTFTATDKSALVTAVSDWLANEASATVTYGHISTWNTTAVTDMEGVLGFASFNAEIRCWDTAAVTTMNTMFIGATVFNQYIDTWNTAKVTTMSYLFYYATAFNEAIGSWNTAAVTTMSYMFYFASVFDYDIGLWDTSKVATMASMFKEATVFNQDIGSWNTAAVTIMGSMFSSASAFNQNIGGWNTAKVTSFGMSSMFRSASVFNQNIGSWNTAKVTSMDNMFNNAAAFDQNLGLWDVAAVPVANFLDMFQGATTFEGNCVSVAALCTWHWSKGQLGIGGICSIMSATCCDQATIITARDLWFSNQGSATTTYGHVSTWDVSTVTDIKNLFNSRGSFNEDLNCWDTSQVEDMYGVFLYASAFNYDVGTWDTASVTNMGAMFQVASAFDKDIGSWNTAKVTSMLSMFYDATVFNQAIGAWNTAAVTKILAMFRGASVFNGDIGSWNTVKVERLYLTFAYATAFNQDIGSWNTAAVTDMQEVFSYATVFNQDVGSWNTAKVTSTYRMFRSVKGFNQDIGSWNTALVQFMGGMFDDATAFNQNIGSWNTATLQLTSADMFSQATAFSAWCPHVDALCDWSLSVTKAQLGITSASCPEICTPTASPTPSPI